MAAGKLNPIHLGEVPAADFLEPLGLSQYRLARDISVSPRRINEIVHGTKSISADSALRLARYFGTSDRFWLNLLARMTSRGKGIISEPDWRKRCEFSRTLANTPLQLTNAPVIINEPECS
jgi:addiction module HigA family antidote